MLVLRTGLPGHSKTLNSIKEIDAEAHASDRPVYFHNISDLAVDKLKANWFEFEDPQKWYELPDNSIVVVDEAQGWFAPRDARKPMPEHLSQFETHRHKGLDIHLITQHGMFLDAHCRRLAGRHVYYWRYWNGKRISRYEFEKFSDTEKKSELKLGRRSIIKIDKAFFGVYKSAVGHHMKFRAPPVLIIAPIFLMLFLVATYYFWQSFAPDTPPEESQPQKTLENIPGRILSNNSIDSNSYNPRIQGVPSTAPIYDRITMPVLAPKLTCFYSEDMSYNAKNSHRLQVLVANDSSVGCGCFTQQGTKENISFELCRAYALNGSFDSSPTNQVRSGVVVGRK